ncbi:hypothetical protein SISNIDRAFT_463304 [Sistotremastrum niveocremeum HHB9708]|uniref:Uncharacterized protein n=1 Tax=Sistotremastrum niveocremeum HHB9708 TaxID=1314777 RepID=A0A164YZX5_9AGAM|nr:hypothetical protein SISNIDRAFT_463304 [Sistotremastrum niveocremeum HHB9708]
MIPHLPPEICGEIARCVRESGSETTGWKTRRAWSSENQSLVALSLTSKLWRIEATPVLWSYMVLEFLSGESTDIEAMDSHIAQIVSLLAIPSPRYAFYLKRLSLLVCSTDSERRKKHVISLIQQLLSHSTQVRYFQYLNFDSDTLLPSLQLPALRVLDLKFDGGFSIALSAEEQLSIASFLALHPRLEDISFMLPVVGWTLQARSKFGSFSNLKAFHGNPILLRVFEISPEITSLKLRIPLPSYAELRRPFLSLESPFPKVTSLSFNGTRPGLTRDNIDALSRYLPALVDIDGFDVADDFIDLMKTNLEGMAWRLPDVQNLVIYESEDMGSSHAMGDALNPEIKESLFRLHYLFPSIKSAKFVGKAKGAPDVLLQWLDSEISVLAQQS